jgi:hypothetical protein
MIQIFSDPLLLDFVKICVLMPPDERAQIESFTGQDYNIDAVAIGNYMVQGPKWVIKDGNDNPLVVGGFSQQRPGVWRDYMLTTPQAWEAQYWLSVTRSCRRFMDYMLHSKQAHRLECIVPRVRYESRPELARWYKVMKYEVEGVRYGYCADGQDAIALARVEH